jgi:hypothetical protein
MVEYNEITDEGLQAISTSELMSNLLRLYIEGNPYTDDGFTLLAESEYLQQLEYPEFTREEAEEEVVEEGEEFEDVEIEDVDEEEDLGDDEDLTRQVIK